MDTSLILQLKIHVSMILLYIPEKLSMSHDQNKNNHMACYNLTA